MDSESLNDTIESEGRLDTSRSSTSEEATTTTKTKVPYALHINSDDKENSMGDKPAAPNPQNKTGTKKPKTPTEQPSSHSLRAPYAQPVLDASKLLNGGDARKSTIEERLASARERRIQQQKQIESSSQPEQENIEMGLIMRKEKEDQAHAKWVQIREEKKKKIEENKMKDDAHRKEVESRKKQQLEEEKKKAEAKIAHTEQVYEVKMRQKRNSSSDRGGVKRWSWGGADGDNVEPNKCGSMTNLVSPSTGKPRLGEERFSKSPLLVNTTHLAFASGLRSYDSSPNSGSGGKGSSTEGSPRVQRSHSLGSRPKRRETRGMPSRTSSVERISFKKQDSAEATPAKAPIPRGRSPTPHVTLTTTARIREQLAKNQKLSATSGRPSTAPGLTEPCVISPRLLAPTRASLARSRNAVNDLDDTASQSSTGSSTHTGPMRSRSKDRRNKEKTPGRSDSGSHSSSPRVEGAKSTPPMRKPTPERKSTPTASRGASPMLGPRRRAPSPAKANGASTGSESKNSAKSTSSDPSKLQKDVPSPQAKTRRAPSPAKLKKPSLSDTSLSTPPRSSTGGGHRAGSPSPAVAKTSVTKAQATGDSKHTSSTPPNIKPSLRPSATQLKTRSSPAAAKPATTKSMKTSAPKAKSETPKSSDKPKKMEKKIEHNLDKKDKINDTNSKEQHPADEESPKEKITEATLSVSTSTNIPKSLSDTSQAVSDIPSSELEDKDSLGIPPAVHPVGSLEENAGAAEDAQVITPELDLQDADKQKQEEAESAKSQSADEDALSANQSQESTPAPAEEGQKDYPVLESPKLEAKDTEGEVQQEYMQTGGQKQDQEHKETEKEHVEIDRQDSSPDYFVTVNPVDPDASSPQDSLEGDFVEKEQEVVQENSLKSELEASVGYPSVDGFSLQSQDKPDQKQEEKQEETVESNDEESDGDSESTMEAEQVEPEVHDVPESGGQQQEAGEEEAGDLVTATQEEPNLKESICEQAEDKEPSTPKMQDAKLEEEESEERQKSPAEVVVAQEEVKEEETGVDDKKVESRVSGPETVVEEVTEIKVEPVEEKTKTEEAAPAEKEDSATSSESAPSTERKSHPRKNLATEEDKEAYRQAIAEKRREAKEKREQEERERQERIRLAKIEQAKREEEARRMFEEAAAAAELERKQEEERKRLELEAERKRQELEKKMEEEANAKKREAAEQLKREREAQKQKQEDERMARKKRIEMIMRRTRQPEADSTKTRSRETSASPTGTPSPQNTPVSQSPALGPSPQTHSPVGGSSPLISLTPERSMSPATTEYNTKRNDNYLLSDSSASPIIPDHTENNNVQAENVKNKLQAAEEIKQDALTFTNSAPSESGVELIRLENAADVATGNVEKPTPFEAFTVNNVGITNGVEHDVENHNKNTNNKDPFSLFSGMTDGTEENHQMSVSINGSENLINMNPEIISPVVSSEPLVPTGI